MRLVLKPSQRGARQRCRHVSVTTHLFDEGHGESVPGDDAVIHQLHEGRERERKQVAETATE